MPIFEIEGPDGIYEVDAPDEASAVAAFQGMGGQQSPPEAADTGGYGSQIMSGLFEGATSALGAPVDLANSAIGLGLHGVNSIFGTDYQPSAEPLGGSAGLRRGLAIAPPSEEVGPQMARRIAQPVGSAILPVAGTANSLGQAAAGIVPAAAGGVAAALTDQVTDNPYADVAAELIGGGLTAGGMSVMASRSARNAAEQAVPSIDELRGRATGLYEQAEARGVVASPEMTQNLAEGVRRIARENELITPTGRVSGAYPRASEAMNLLDDYSGHSMNPTQMQVIRDTLADARNATQGKERRIAGQMLREFDDFASPLAPELEQARAISQRAFKGSQLDQMRDLAGARAGQFTGSGFENALRTEYRALDRNIVKGREQGWSPAEIQAIQDVSRGTPASNTARNIGRMAPTGPVSFGATVGLPFAIGNTFGGPAVGAAASAGAAGLGYAGRAAATQMGIRNATVAELLARNGGGQISGAGLSPETREIVAQLLASRLSAGQQNVVDY